MQQMRDNTPHNFIQKTDQNMYGNSQGQYGYNQSQNNQQPQYYRPYQNYGVNSNDRPPVVSDGGCCCSIMWLLNIEILLFYRLRGPAWANEEFLIFR